MNTLPFEYELRITGLFLLGALLLYCISKQKHLVAGIILGFGWYEYFTTNFGFVLDVGKLFGIVCLFVLSTQPKYFHSLGAEIVKKYWMYFFVYCVAITIISAPSWPSQSDGADGVLYTTLRWLVQIVNMTLGFGIALVVASFANSPQRLARCTKIMMVAALILVAVGIYQYFAAQLGLPINTIARQGGLGSTIAATRIDGEQVFRIYSLSGEPKGFATSICVPILLLLLYGTKKEVTPIHRYLRIPMTLSFLACIYFTLSTAGFVILTIALIAAVGAQVYARVEYKTGLYSMGSLVAVVLGASLIFDTGNFTDKLKSTYSDRVESRLSSEEETFTYGEKGVFEMWKESPHLVVTGVGLGGSSFYIRNYQNKYKGYTASARGIVGVLADIGIIGVLLLYIPMVILLLKTGVILRGHQFGKLYIVPYVICASGMTLMLTRSAWFFPYAVMGLLCATHTVMLKHNQLIARKKKQRRKALLKRKQELLVQEIE